MNSSEEMAVAVGEFHEVRRQVVDRLMQIRFVESGHVGTSKADRERVWAEFYDAAPEDLQYLVDTVDVLVDWIVAAASVAVQIRDKRNRVGEDEREAAIDELAGFLEDRVAVLTSQGSDRVDTTAGVECEGAES